MQTGIKDIIWWAAAETERRTRRGNWTMSWTKIENQSALENTFFFLNPLKFEALFIVQDYTIVYKIYKKSCRFTNAYQILSFINNKTAGINIYTHIYVGYANENS